MYRPDSPLPCMPYFADSWSRFGNAGVRLLVLLSLAVLALSSLAGQPAHAASRPKTERGAEADSQSRRARLSASRAWAYQLRIHDLAPLVASAADLLVVDHGYAARHDGKIMFEPAEVAKLKRKPDGSRRLVIAYMSIGEVEQYRFYWQGSWCSRATAPPWIGAVNPNWPGNYPARFWHPDWQKLILDPAGGYLSHIQTQGFDGIYLDRTDVYGEWSQERPSAEADMIAFLSEIGAVARKRDPAFLIVMQNAEELLVHKAVRRLLDGVAKEDLLHGLQFTEAANDAAAVDSAVTDLKRAQADGLPVFAVEYLSDPIKITAARDRLLHFGFVPYFAPRLLDKLMLQPGDQSPLPTGSAAPAETMARAQASAPSPTTPPTASLPAVSLPAASWAEGAPTCLRD